MTEISAQTFANCTSLKSVTIPDSITKIMKSAFSGCSALETVDYLSVEDDWNKVTVYEGNEAIENATVTFKEQDSGIGGKPSLK